MDIETIAQNYLSFLEKGDIPKILSLFTKDGTVVSPVYGTKPAREFYQHLSNDTHKSVIKFDGIFFEKEKHRIALLFDYQWVLKNHKKVAFKVMDIIDFNDNLKIEKLTIIYDTVVSRDLVKSLK